MVSALHSGVSAVSSSPHRGHCTVFSGKTFYSHSGSLHSEFNAEGHPRMDWHPIQGEVEILLKSLHATETGISSGLMGHLAYMQTLPWAENIM